MRNEFLRTLRSLVTSRRERWRMATEGNGEFVSLWQAIGGHLRNSSVGLLDSIPNLLEESNPAETDNAYLNSHDSYNGPDREWRVVGELVDGQTCLRFPDAVINPNTGVYDLISRHAVWDETTQLGNRRQWGLALWVWPQKYRTAKILPIWVQWTEFTPHTVGVGVNDQGQLNVMLETVNGGGTCLVSATTTEQIMSRSRWRYLTVEYDADAATEEGRLTLTVDFVVRPYTISYSPGPAPKLQTGLKHTQSAAIGSSQQITFTSDQLLDQYEAIASATDGFVGLMGPDIIRICKKETGSEIGLLTHASRQVLAGLRAPSLPPFVPAVLSPIIGQWSATGATTASLPNRITTGTVPAFVQATEADRPQLITFTNAIEALVFDGLNADMRLPVVAAVKQNAFRWYWAWHIRFGVPTNTQRVIYSEWSTGGASVGERMMVSTDANNRLNVSIATSAFTFVTNIYEISLDIMQAGMWLEIIFNGSDATAANRIRVYVDGVELARFASGAMPSSLQTGDAVDFWIGSQAGALNSQQWLAALYIVNDRITPDERSDLRAFEAPSWVVSSPPVVDSLVAHWSGGGGSFAGELVNRKRGLVGSLWQADLAKRPQLYQLANAVRYVALSGSAELQVRANANMKQTGPERYWAWHLRRLDVISGSRVLYSEATGAVRFSVRFDAATLIVTVAGQANTYAIDAATQRAGMFLELIFNGAEAAAADRLRAFVAGVELARVLSGTIPAALPASADTDFLLNGETSALRADADLAHFYVCAAAPTTPERDSMRAFEAPAWTMVPVPQVDGIVTAWLRARQATLEYAQTSDVADLANPANPAVSAGGARPTLSGDSSGLPTLLMSLPAQVLPWPAAANHIGGLARWGLATWFMLSSFAGSPVLYRNRNVVDVVEISFTATEIVVSIWNGTTARVATVSGTPVALHVPTFLTVEFDGTQAAEADRLVITVGNVATGAVKKTFALTGATTLPPALNTPDGGSSIGVASAQFFSGRLGANFWILQGLGGIAGGGLLTDVQRAALLAYQPMATDALSVTLGAVGSWLRADRAYTTGNGVAVLPDVLSASSAAQSVDARRPPLSLSSNGLPVLTFSGGQTLSWPLAPPNNGSSLIGFGFWVRHTGLAAARTLLCISDEGIGTADAKKLMLYFDATNRIMADIFRPAGTGYEGRRQTGPVVAANAWTFVTWEYDSTRATESSRSTFSVAGTTVSSTYAAISSGSSFTLLRTPNGNAVIGAQDDDAALISPFTGNMGPNLYTINAKMSGATTGLLTTAGRQSLMAIDVPT